MTKLESFVPRKLPKKRKFIAVSAEDYEFIAGLSEALDTTRGKVITTLIRYYEDANKKDGNRGGE